MEIWALVIGCGMLLATGRALFLGAASAGADGITRQDEPLFYWLCVVSGVAAAAVLLYVGLRGAGD